MSTAVIGGGVAGCMAAAVSAQGGTDTVLFEKNEKLLKKMYITGKGRCNLTNDTDREGLLAAVQRNARFLYSAFSAFGPADTMALFEGLGVPLKTERGGRVFPVSDKSGDITRAFARYVSESGARVRLNCAVSGVEIAPGGGFSVRTAEGAERFDRVIIATGGVSYPSTGSTGDGYRFASAFGHSLEAPVPSLVGIDCADACCPRLAGLTLKNVRVTAKTCKKAIAEEFGELLFTHTGVSGPTALTLSARLNRLDLASVRLFIDLKPALSAEQLDARLLRDLSENANRAFKNSLSELLPKSLIAEVVERCGIPPDKQCNSVTAAERARLSEALKAFCLTPTALGAIEGAIVTSGGVKTGEVDPKTMESKRVPGLYFAGEVLDVDAKTGGFNIQIALSTGYAAGMAQGKEVLK